MTEHTKHTGLRAEKALARGGLPHDHPGLSSFFGSGCAPSLSRLIGVSLYEAGQGACPCPCATLFYLIQPMRSQAPRYRTRMMAEVSMP